MSIRSYYDSSNIRADVKVVQCDPVESGYRVILDDTIFHPQGGGQPSDKGTINGEEVISVRCCDTGIYHLLANPVKLGDAEIILDTQAREVHSRLHSAGHVIGYLGETLGWRAIQGHHFPGEGRVAFTGYDAADLPQPEELEYQVNQLIRQGGKQNQHFDGQGYRMVGFDDLIAYPCGGTHVDDLTDIGSIRIMGIKNKKGKLTIRYDIEG
ncbi:alanyl-tRNA editing protein [Dongshaea marina]|uniref:hypothetical protein n=1 Tax=Dongshaea marina TaxID=2047966 RepID=UPI000D3E15BB|nr:hypothetical protein [Dongshaea marina]